MSKHTDGGPPPGIPDIAASQALGQAALSPASAASAAIPTPSPREGVTQGTPADLSATGRTPGFCYDNGVVLSILGASTRPTPAVLTWPLSLSDVSEPVTRRLRAAAGLAHAASDQAQADASDAPPTAASPGSSQPQPPPPPPPSSHGTPDAAPTGASGGTPNACVHELSTVTVSCDDLPTVDAASVCPMYPTEHQNSINGSLLGTCK